MKGSTKLKISIFGVILFWTAMLIPWERVLACTSRFNTTDWIMFSIFESIVVFLAGLILDLIIDLETDLSITTRITLTLTPVGWIISLVWGLVVGWKKLMKLADLYL